MQITTLAQLHDSDPYLAHLQQPVVLQVLRNNHHGLLYARLLAVNVDLWLLWCLVRRTDTSELLDLTSLRLLVQTLGISLLSDVDWHIDKDLDERQGAVGVLCIGVKFASDLTVGFVRRDKGC